MIWVDHISGHYRLTLGGTFANYLDSGQTPAIGRWQHVAATYDGTTARFYIDGVAGGELDLHRQRRRLEHLADRARTARTPAGFFDGLVDNVRIYDRALSPTEIQTDMASRIQPDLTPPAVTAFTPASGTTGLNVGSSVDGDVQQPMQSSTVNATTFQLKDPAGNTVPATISYDSSTNDGDADSEGCARSTGPIYTAPSLPAGGVKDLGGNPLAADARLVVHDRGLAAAAARGRLERQPVRDVSGEILRNEGLDAFTTIDASLLSSTVLSDFDVVLLGDTP